MPSKPSKVTRCTNIEMLPTDPSDNVSTINLKANHAGNGLQVLNWSGSVLFGITGAGLQLNNYATGITALAGGGQAGASQLTAEVNRVTTAATQGDSVGLPDAVAGLTITIVNKGANPIQVYGNNPPGDTINGIATGTGVSQGINTVATYTCTVAGNWEIPISALSTTSPALISASGAVPPHVQHTYVVTKAGVAALTLAAPTAGTDDGIEIGISSSTAHAHTLTATGLLQTGSASVNLATFAAEPGAGLTLMAYNGNWIVTAQIGITFS